MILIGCFLAFGLAVAPRLFLVLAWILSERWVRVWQGEFLLPLLGIIFLPYTTIMYMLVWTPRGIEGWDWLWILLGLLLDIWKWQQIFANRKAAMDTSQQYYSSRSSRGSGGSGGSGGTTRQAVAAPAAADPVPAASATTATAAGAPPSPDATSDTSAASPSSDLPDEEPPASSTTG